jgi:hypothetical protein
MNKGEDSAPVADDVDVSSLLSLELELAPAWAKKAPTNATRILSDHIVFSPTLVACSAFTEDATGEGVSGGG